MRQSINYRLVACGGCILTVLGTGIDIANATDPANPADMPHTPPIVISIVATASGDVPEMINGNRISIVWDASLAVGIAERETEPPGAS